MSEFISNDIINTNVVAMNELITPEYLHTYFPNNGNIGVFVKKIGKKYEIF